MVGEKPIALLDFLIILTVNLDTYFLNEYAYSIVKAKIKVLTLGGLDKI